MDAGTWGAIGGGLTALSEGLTARELRKQAEEQRRLERERQERMDALNKAIQAANSAEGLRKENFKRVGKKEDSATQRRILNEVAMGRKNEEYTDPVSGDVYMRGEGESPLDIAQATKEREQALRAEVARGEAANRAAIEAMRQENINKRWVDPSGNVQLQETGRNDRWGKVSGNVQAQQAGANYRADQAQAGQDRRSTSGPGSMKTTVAQAQAKLFGGLMDGAEKEIAKNPWGTQPLSAPMEIALEGRGKGVFRDAAAAVARSRMTPEQQRAQQSRLQFTQAALYAFSGKSAPESEVAKNVYIFFPVSGETDGTVAAQKKRARDLASMLLQRRRAGEMIEGVDPQDIPAFVNSQNPIGGIAPAGSARSQPRSLGTP